MLGEHLDLTNEPDVPPPANASARGRFLGIHFQCCGRYAHIYPNRQRTAYVGYCPGCGQRVEILIGPGGSDSRFFSVS